MAFVSLQRSSRRVARAGAAISKWRRRVRIVRRLLLFASAVIAIQRFLSDSGGSGGGGGAVSRPQPSPPAPKPATEPLASSGGLDGVPVAVTASANRSAAADDQRWVAAADDTAPPDGFPVKVNGRSGIYHLPGGLAYDRTRPDRWYRSAADAEADGFRASKA